MEEIKSIWEDTESVTDNLGRALWECPVLRRPLRVPEDSETARED